MLSKILNFLKMIALTLVIAIMLFVVFAIVSASGAGDKLDKMRVDVKLIEMNSTK
jgi:hypothetical protein